MTDLYTVRHLVNFFFPFKFVKFLKLIISIQAVSNFFSFLGLVPLFGIDVWEHAYYLQYKNVRPDYVKSIYNVANWDDVSERYLQAIGKA